MTLPFAPRSCPWKLRSPLHQRLGAPLGSPSGPALGGGPELRPSLRVPASPRPPVMSSRAACWACAPLRVAPPGRGSSQRGWLSASEHWVGRGRAGLPVGAARCAQRQSSPSAGRREGLLGNREHRQHGALGVLSGPEPLAGWRLVTNSSGAKERQLKVPLVSLPLAAGGRGSGCDGPTEQLR